MQVPGEGVGMGRQVLEGGGVGGRVRYGWVGTIKEESMMNTTTCDEIPLTFFLLHICVLKVIKIVRTVKVREQDCRFWGRDGCLGGGEGSSMGG